MFGKYLNIVIQEFRLVSVVSFGMQSLVCRDSEETLTVMHNKIEDIRLARRVVTSSTSVADDDTVVGASGSSKSSPP